MGPDRLGWVCGEGGWRLVVLMFESCVVNSRV